MNTPPSTTSLLKRSTSKPTMRFTTIAVMYPVLMMTPAAAASRPYSAFATLGTKYVTVNCPKPPSPTMSASIQTTGERNALRLRAAVRRRDAGVRRVVGRRPIEQPEHVAPNTAIAA